MANLSICKMFSIRFREKQRLALQAEREKSAEMKKKSTLCSNKKNDGQSRHQLRLFRNFSVFINSTLKLSPEFLRGIAFFFLGSL